MAEISGQESELNDVLQEVEDAVYSIQKMQNNKIYNEMPLNFKKLILPTEVQ